MQELHKALTDIFSTAIQESNVVEVCTLMQIDEETKIDLGLFSSVAAIAERLLYPHFVYVYNHIVIVESFKYFVIILVIIYHAKLNLILVALSNHWRYIGC